MALGGFLLGAVLLIAAALPALPTSTLVLMPVALVLNVVLGQLMGTTGLPFYVDAIGTVLIAVLAGPAAGAATGALSTIVWSFINPTVLPFAAGAALIGFLAGLAARGGLFRRFYLAPVAGFVTGILAGVVSAPIAAFVFGGTAGLGTGAVVSAFRAMGDTLLAAITKQALISDPMDKAIVFAIAALLVYALPRRTTFQFPFVRKFRVLAGKSVAAPERQPRLSRRRSRESAGQPEQRKPELEAPTRMPSTLHPLTSLTAAGCTAVITTAAGHWPLSVAVALAAALLAVRAGVGRRVLAAAAAVLLPLGLSLLMLHGLFFPEGRTVLAAWGPARVTAEGLSFALEAGTRTGACVLVLLLFSFTVSAPDLVAALAARGLPPQFGFVLASALTLLPAMAGTARSHQGGAGGPRTGGPRRCGVPARCGTGPDGPARPGPDGGLREPGPGPRRPRLRQPGPHAPATAKCRTRPSSAGSGPRCWCSPVPPWHSGSGPPGRLRDSHDNRRRTHDNRRTRDGSYRHHARARRADRPDRQLHLPRGY